jgi:hypothetical protein
LQGLLLEDEISRPTITRSWGFFVSKMDRKDAKDAKEDKEESIHE